MLKMLIPDKIRRFSRKKPSQQVHTIKVTLRRLYHAGIGKLCGKKDDTEFLLASDLAPPKVLRSRNRLYIAYRPDSDIDFDAYPELRSLCEDWVRNNVRNNAGDLPRLYAILLNIKQVMAEGIPGDFAELGVYRGNSAAVLAHYARRHDRSVFLFDTFEGFEAKDMTGIDANKKHEFADTSLDLVRKNVGDEAIVFVKGYFPDSIIKSISERRYAIVHLDCDLYEPMKAGLEFFYPRLSSGGMIIIHDYSNMYWDGVKRAVDEYVAKITENLILIPDKSGTAMLRKSR